MAHNWWWRRWCPPMGVCTAAWPSALLATSPKNSAFRVRLEYASFIDFTDIFHQYHSSSPSICLTPPHAHPKPHFNPTHFSFTPSSPSLLSHPPETTDCRTEQHHQSQLYHYSKLDFRFLMLVPTNIFLPLSPYQPTLALQAR